MTEISYRDHSIKIVLTQDPATLKWSARGTVTFMGMGGPIVHPIEVSGVFEKQEHAEQAVETKAKAWIDQGKR